jgi:4-amino-4-deoxy-L-arabinose transferase-like glycosyltransferase
VDRRSVGGRLGTDRTVSLDVLALGALVALAAVLRFVDLPTRGTWDADQGHAMTMLLALVRDGSWPLLGDATSIAGIHQGAVYYYLLAPAAWVSGADPVAVVGEIALLGVVAVALAWWVARSVAGPLAGVAAGLVMAVSATAIRRSTFIWNPNVLAFSTLLAVAGALQAWRTGHVRWWLVSAAGIAITVQSHVLGIVLLPPIAIAFVADVRRTPPAERGRFVGVGVAAIAIVALSYLPLLIYELGHDFAESRAALAFLAGGGPSAALDPVSRLLFVGLRILAWPLTGLLTDAPIAGVSAAIGVVAILAWRARVATGNERWFVRWLAAALAWCWIVLGFGVAGLATVTPLPVDHYHAFLDPLVFAIVGLGAAGLWNGRRAGGGSGERAFDRALGPVVASLILVGLVAWNVTIWPPAVTPDGGWPAARVAGARIESSAGPGSIALLSLPAFKSPEAYAFPLVRAGREIVNSAVATSVVIVCDSLFVAECAGAAEDRAIADVESGATGALRLVDQFEAAPGRTISVYRRE